MPNNYGSILSNGDDVSSLEDVIKSKETLKFTNGAEAYGSQLENLDRGMSQYLDGSTRLIGAPHQFLAHNDNRYGNSSIGRRYAEKIIMEAPVIYIKPGVSEFLPGVNGKERAAFVEALNSYSGGDRDAIKAKLNNDGDDMIQYFGIKPDFNGYMTKVNMLNRMLATFLGINKLKVPWVNSNLVTFGNYDWRYYRMSSQYGNLKMEGENKHGFNAFKDIASKASEALMNDYEYIQFYVTPDSSYSQSFSNTTTSSVLENLTGQLEGIAKELQVISSMSGQDISGLAESATSSLDSYIQENATGDGPIATMLRRVTGASKQVINGGNFILPEIWNDSSSDSSFSFSVHLVAPYGNKLSWYINVGVPMMFCISLVLPVQQTANVVASPYLLKCFSPGWFTGSMCIADSLSIEKGPDGTWNKANLPNDVTIRISVKDLYSQLALPQSNSPGEFMANTGMLEFLMTTAGVDISRQDIGDKWEVWKSLFKNQMTDLVQRNAYDLSMAFKHHASGIFKILQ